LSGALSGCLPSKSVTARSGKETGTQLVLRPIPTPQLAQGRPRLCSPQRSSIQPLIANAGWLQHDLFLKQGCLGFPFLVRYPHQEVQPKSSDASSPRSDGDSSRDNGYRLSEVRQVTREDGSVETRKERNVRLAQRRSNLHARPSERLMEVVDATAIDVTVIVRSRVLNSFVRFVVKHLVSGPNAIAPIT
jgi:hypothetical protein